MPISSATSEKLKAHANSMPRDAKGHFIKAGTDPATTVATEVSTQSPLPTIQKPPKKEKGDLDAPLVVINNPFRKLLHWFDEIRRKQTTTFDLKVSVPLIALPIFLIVLGGAFQYVFTLGKQTALTNQPTPTPKSALQTPIPISKVGIIKGTYATVLADEVTPTLLPTNTPIPATPTNTPVPPTFTPTPTPTLTPTPIPPSRFVLVDKDEKIFFLITPTSLLLNRYLNQRVLITGMYDAQKETITIKKSADIEVLP